MVLRRIISLGVALAFLIPPALAGDGKAGKLEIRGAFSRATSSTGNPSVAGAFMAITNTGSEVDQLVGARSAIAETGGTHTHVRDGNVVNMIPVGAIDIPSGHTVMLQPGGMHVMFHGLKKPLVEGDKYALTLRFAKAGEATLIVDVLSSTAMTYAGGPAVMGAGMAGMPAMGASMRGADVNDKMTDTPAASAAAAHQH